MENQVDWNVASDALRSECEALIGKTVAYVEARELKFEISFTDGTRVTFSGSRYDRCALGVDVEVAPSPSPQK